MKYILDTNICIYIIKKHPDSVLKKLTQHKINELCISSITCAELNFGVENSQHPNRNREVIETFILPLNIVDFDYMAAKHYGEIRAALQKQGKTIGPLDMLIAAHARSLNLILVTNNKKEFERVPHLKVINWV